MSKSLTGAAVLLAVLGWAASARAEQISVPNGSFESPTTGFVTIAIDSWQKTAQPPWYNAGGGFAWTQLTGAFLNTVPTSPDHIDNIHGSQAIWLFVVPEVGLFQDYDSVDWRSSTHAFNSTFEVGKAYKLTVGVIGSGGGMLEGASLEISLYYRDSGGNRIKFATKPIVYTEAEFPNNTHLVDCSVEIPVVQSGDPWAGKHIGIQLLSTVPPELEGGYWDLDNVRLTAVAAPQVQSAQIGGNLRVSWNSSLGSQYQLRISENLSSWADYEAPLLGTGGELFKLYPLAGHQRAFFRLVVTPTP